MTNRRTLPNGNTTATRVLLSVAFVALSATAAVAQTFKITVPVPAFTTIACNGEPVSFPEGAVITFDRTVTDSSAGTHTKNQLQAIAKNGVGTLTGMRYRAHTVSDTSSQTTNPPGATTETMTSTTTLAGGGPENNLLMHITITVTTNDRGVTTADFVQMTSECPADPPPLN